jgi:hypothetical protein
LFGREVAEVAEAQDCPFCGLVNPPEAQRCDCGYDFNARRVGRSYMSGSELARQGNHRLPVYVPGGCFSALLLLVITGTNGPGVCVTIVATAVAIVVGGTVEMGAGPYWTGFGLAAVVLDILSRRYLLRCSLGDRRRGTRFMALPVWVLGLCAAALGVAVMLRQ